MNSSNNLQLAMKSQWTFQIIVTSSEENFWKVLNIAVWSRCDVANMCHNSWISLSEQNYLENIWRAESSFSRCVRTARSSIIPTERQCKYLTKIARASARCRKKSYLVSTFQYFARRSDWWSERNFFTFWRWQQQRNLRKFRIRPKLYKGFDVTI